MRKANTAEPPAPEWIQTGQCSSLPGQASVPEVTYECESAFRGERMRVIIDFRLAGYWVSRAPGGFIDQVAIPGGCLIDAPGLPGLPALVHSVALPFGADFDPHGVETQSEQQEAEERVALRARPAPCLEGMAPSVVPEAFERAGWFPAEAAVLGPAPAVDGMARVVVRINPLAVEPLSGRLLIRPRIRVDFACAVRNRGRYDDDRVDALSPVLRSVLGSRELMSV